MNRLEKLKQLVNEIYQANHPSREEWAGWLYEKHIFIVADHADKLSDRFNAKKDIAVAAAMLHDIADAVVSRFAPNHEEESATIARKMLAEAGYSDEDIQVVVDDALKLHSCRDGNAPTTLEGRVMATADALAHLKTDFYEHGVQEKEGGQTMEEIKAWALPKIERDFYKKIQFDDVREETRPDYERIKSYIESL